MQNSNIPNINKLWSKLVIVLSSFGLLSTFGYYLINLENTALGKSQQSPSTIQKQIIKDNKTAQTIEAVVTKVVDGDTIKVQTNNGEKVTVRLLGIDTPETRHSPSADVRGVADCFANEATEALKALVGDKQVILETDKNKPMYDKYGRLLAYIFVGKGSEQANVNKQMVRDGFAYEYTYRGEKYKFQKDFKQAQKEAENTKAGLWGDGVCE